MPRSRTVSVSALALAIVVGLHVPAEACSFRRGDANLDGTVDISDGIRILNVLFLGAAAPDCDDALDANDEGTLDISDGIFLFGFLFTGGAALAAPFPDCGQDSTPDGLSCIAYTACGPCVSEAGVRAAMAVITSDLCILPGLPQDVSGATVTILPASRAVPCGPAGDPGWPIEMTSELTSLDMTLGQAVVHVVGQIRDLPVTVRTVISGECRVDSDFQGDAIFVFHTIESAGNTVVTSVELQGVENRQVDLDIAGGLLCDLGSFLSPFFEDLLADQIESFYAGEVDSLSEELGCRAICTNQ